MSLADEKEFSSYYSSTYGSLDKTRLIIRCKCGMYCLKVTSLCTVVMQ